MPDPTSATSRRDRILRAASRLFGRPGLDGVSLTAIAREAGVSRELLRRSFPSKERLLIQAQRATFQQLYQRFEERAQRGERGLPAAMDALDAMWASVRELSGSAPFIAQTLTIGAGQGVAGRNLTAFYRESTSLLEGGIRAVFADDLDQLALPPGRMAILIRVALEGLVVELARAEGPDELRAVDQAFDDMRELFRRFVLSPAQRLPTEDEPVPLPW
ncbi:MAG: TetR/AcrR family transcriptional regulator [Alphaproteobacteria bacterium]|nr:TetR/AcrR family transcriptional regulator [Alphaproteobacteria bacterium]